MLGTAGEVKTNSKVKFSGIPNMDAPVLADQQRLIFISSVWTLDAG